MRVQKIRSRLLFLSFAAIALVLFLFLSIFLQTLQEKKGFDRSRDYTLELKTIADVIHWMQLERGISIALVTKQAERQEEQRELQSVRQELTRVIDAARALNPKHAKSQTFSTLLEVIQEERQRVRLANFTPSEIKERYTNKIAMLLTYASTIPTLMEERQNRNFMQAFLHLATAKEALGIIRATLNQSLIVKELPQKERIEVQNALTIYHTQKERFENNLPEEFLATFQSTLEGAKITKTLTLIEQILENQATPLEPQIWFEEATRTIEFFKKSEDTLFAYVQKMLSKSIQSAVYKLTLIVTLSLLLGALFIAMIVAFVRTILFSANKLNEEYADSMALLEQYKSTVDRSFIVSKTDARGIITYVNDEFCKISGYSREEVLGKSHKLIRHPQTPKTVFQEMWHTIKVLKKPWCGEIQNLSKTKQNYWTKAIINPILDHNGNVVEYIGIRTDITEIENAKEAALSAQRAKSAFLDTMSHELRTPLNAVIGFAQIIKAKSDLSEEKRVEYIEKIYLSGMHLLGLVNNILDFSKIDAGKMQLHVTEFLLNDFLGKTIPLIEAEAHKKGIIVHKEGIGEERVSADEQLFKQVVLNILSNAVKFSPSHTTITLFHTHQEQHHCIKICDEGVGLSKEQMRSLFEPFSQIKEHQNQAIKGTGLGLAISQKIMQLHGGSIEVTSTLGKGSCFSILLPKTKE